MTLKEKFHQWLSTEPYNLRDRVTIREVQCEVIADEFAIGFAEWCLDENHIILNDGKELLKIYKKEKGL